MTRISSFCQAALCGLAFFLFLSLLALPGSRAHAGSFAVNPVRVSLGDEKVAALTLRNTGDTDVAIQARLVQWEQVHGEDHFTETRNVLVTPPIVNLSAGATQTIRVGLRGARDRDTELSYRLFLQEIPSTASENGTGLKMVTRLSLPVFVAPTSGFAKPALRWVVQEGPRGEILLAAYNAGQGHAQLSDPSLHFENGRRLTLRGNHYLLPGTDRTWVIQPQGVEIERDSRVKLSVTVNGQDADVGLQVQ